MTKENNPYIDANNIDRAKQIERAFAPTLEDIYDDPHFYAELVNDLMFHWVYGTQETKLTFLQEDSPANPTQWQEKDLVKKMTATSGQKCLESLEKLNQVGLWAKMFTGLLIGMEGWYSTKCKLIWKLKGTKYGRFYCQLRPLTLPTEGTEYGLLPTPKTMDGMAENVNSGKELKLINGSFVNIRPKDGMRFGPSLNDIARHRMLPTPTAMDSTNATVTMKSTQVKEGSMHSVTLTRALSMGMLPTPCARDTQGPQAMEYKKWKGLPHNNIQSVPGVVRELTGSTSQLSPQFVMEMMGFPTDWTELPFLNGETNQSKQEEMQ